MIISRYLHPERESHSLEAWGGDLGFPKGEIDDYTTFTERMAEYCENDVLLTERLYWSLVSDLTANDMVALDCEHRIASVCTEMSDNGFGFDIEKAQELRATIATEVTQLESDFQTAFPPTPRLGKKGNILGYEPFNPGSPKQLVDKLWDAQWRPTEKTDGHRKYRGRDKIKLDRYSRYGWKVNENNLASLPADAPPVYSSIVRYVLLSARIRRLDEWINLYDSNSKGIHGRFTNLGTWTHRFIHSAPNMGNVAAEKSIKYKGEELAALATRLGREMRQLWVKHSDADYLVGTDAEGIQLRVLAHYINDPVFTAALVSGDKALGTDVHSLNQRALGRGTRDTAKTF